MSKGVASCFLRARRMLVVATVIGFGAFAAGLTPSPSQAWGAFLVSDFYFFALALGGLVFMAMMTVSNASWHTPLKRIPESLAAYLPLGALGTLGLLNGLPWLYHWAHSEAALNDKLLQAKVPYLNKGFFSARMIGVLAVWVILGMLMRRSFLRHGHEPGWKHSRHSMVLSAAFLAVFPVSFSMASIDWLMSLEPHWSSSIFGLYSIAGLLSSTIAAVSVIAILLRRKGALPNVNSSHLHDLGKLLFGFSTVWAYLWFSQYLLVWYTNLPEENTHYVARLTGNVSVVFFLNFLLSWALPFVLLLSKNAKRSDKTLMAASVLVLVGRWLDVHLLVAPAVSQSYHGITALDIALFLGFGGGFLFIVDYALEKAPVVHPQEAPTARKPKRQPVPVAANAVAAKESLYGS